jgi:hypothetical protein
VDSPVRLCPRKQGYSNLPDRYELRRTVESVGHLDWDHYLGSLLQFFGSFSKTPNWMYVTIATLGFVLLALGSSQHMPKLYRQLFPPYILGAVLSYFAFSLLGMHEIEARYYFFALPYLYYVISDNAFRAYWQRVLLAGWILLQCFSYSRFMNESYRPQMTASKFLLNNLQPGDQVCSPFEPRYALKLRNTLKFMLAETQIHGLDLDSFFSMFDLYRNQKNLDSDSVWVYSKQPFDMSQLCLNPSNSKKCAEPYFAVQLNGFSITSAKSFDYPPHAPIFLTRLTRKK